MKKIIVFASGQGSNLKNIINYFKGKSIKVCLIVSNKPESGAIKISKENNIPYFLLNKNWIDLQKECLLHNPDLIILSGFLLKLPQEFIKNIKCKIVNIHPSLLPKYGGKGMYGSNVHRLVLENKEKQSGITIHYVNESYDEGEVIFQKEINLNDNTTLEELQSKIHNLEYEYFPKVIESLIC